jgi:hypothetical protein
MAEPRLKTSTSRRRGGKRRRWRLTALAVFAVVLTGVFGAAWAEDDDQITPLAAGASISHDFVKDWSHEKGDDEWDWQSAAAANAGGSAALLAPLKPGIFGISEEATFSRERMQNQLDTANGLSLHLTEVNDARVLANETGLFTPGGGINGVLMKIVRAVFGSLLWLVYIVAMAVQKILEATMTVVGSLNPANIFIGVEGLGAPSGTVVDGLTIEDSASQLRDFWSAAQGTGIIIVGVLGAVGVAASLLGSHKMSKVFRSTLTRLLFIVAFIPLAFGLFGAVVDWAANAISSSASASNEVVLTHMVDTEAWAAHSFDIPSDSLCGTVGPEKTEIDSGVLASIIIPDGKNSSVANRINTNNGVTSDDAMALLGRWMSSSSVSASEMSAIVHDQLIDNSDVETVKGDIEDMIDNPGDEDDDHVLISGGTMTKSGDCYAGKFSPIGTIAFGSLESKNNSVTIKTASSSATSVGFNDFGIQSVSMVGQGFNGFLVYILIMVLLACPAFLGVMYGWGLVSETVKIGVRMVGHVTLGFLGSLRSIIAAVVGFCGLMASIIATVVLYAMSSILLGVLPGRITGSITALTGSGATEAWILPVGIILGCVIAVVMTFALIKLRGAIVGGVGAAMSRILAKLVGFDDLEAQRAGDEAVAQSGVGLAGGDADALGKSAKKGAGAAASLAVGAAVAGAGGLMGRAGAAIGSMMGAGGGSGSGSGPGSGSGGSGSGSAAGAPAGGGSSGGGASAGSAGGAPAGSGGAGAGAGDNDGSDDDSSADGDGDGSDAGDTDVDASSGDTDVDGSSDVDVDVDGSAEAQGQPDADGGAVDDGGAESPDPPDDAGPIGGSAPDSGGETGGSSGETDRAEPADQQAGPPDQPTHENSPPPADQPSPEPSPQPPPQPQTEDSQADQGGAPGRSAPAPDQTAEQRRAETEAEETRRLAAEDKARLAAAAAAPAAWANARLNPFSERRFQRRQAKTAQGQDYAEKKLRDFNQATAQLKAAERMAQANPSRAAKRQLQKAQAKAAKAGQQTLLAAKRVGSTARIDDHGRMRLQHTDPQPGRLLEQRRKAGARRDRRKARTQRAGQPGSPDSSNSPS